MIPAVVPERKLNLSPMARAVMLGCQTACHADDFAQKLVSNVARVFRADFCIWADRTSSGLDPVALTSGAEGRLLDALLFSVRALDAGPVNTGSLLAAPMLFRSQVAGVLVVGGSSGFSGEHAHALMVIGRAAVVRHEQFRLAEELALAPGSDDAPGVVAQLVHELSQPLSVIGAAAFYINMVLPPSESKLRCHIEKMEEQVDIAAQLLQNISRSVRLSHWGANPEPDRDRPDLTKSVSSSLV